MRPRPRLRLIPMFAIAAILLNFDAAFACSPKSKAYLSATKSNLRDLMTAEESFYAAHKRYTGSIEELGFRPRLAALPGIRITASGYTAMATHAELPGMTCYLFIGPKPVGLQGVAGRAEGEPWCEGKLLGQPQRASTTMANSVAVLLVALTLASAFFLDSRRRKNWPARGLFLVTLAYLAAFKSLESSCGPALPELPMAILALGGVGLFWLAYRSRVGLA